MLLKQRNRLGGFSPFLLSKLGLWIIFALSLGKDYPTGISGTPQTL